MHGWLPPGSQASFQAAAPRLTQSAFEASQRDPALLDFSEKSVTPITWQLRLWPITMVIDAAVLAVDRRDTRTMIADAGMAYASVEDAFALFQGDAFECDYCQYGILYCQASLSLVSKELPSLAVGIAQRLEKSPPARAKRGTPEWAVQLAALRMSSSLLADAMKPHVGDIPSILACAAVMGGVRGRTFIAGADVVNQGETRVRVSASLKAHEQLPWKYIHVNGEQRISVKPRLICPVSEKGHHDLIPVARCMMDALKDALNNRVLTLDCPSGPVLVEVWIVCGFNGRAVSRLGDRIEACPHWCFAISGDDGVTAVHPAAAKGRMFLEADMAQYEASEADAHGQVMIEILDAVMGSPEFGIMLRECLAAGFKVKHKSRISILVTVLTMMQKSGLGTTTLMNCVIHVLMVLRLVQVTPLIPRSREAMSDLFADNAACCGLTVTSSYTEDFGQVVFLRGWWRVGVTGDRVFLPLAGMVAKLGKISGDPVTVTRQENRPRLSMPQAIKRVANSVAACYRIDTKYPIFGAMMATYRRLGESAGIVEDKNRVIERAAYKALYEDDADIMMVDQGDSLAAMATRYGVSPHEILELDKMIRGVQGLPALVRHPLLFRLTELDYGSAPVDLDGPESNPGFEAR
jgi:hypothetical protein